MIGVAGHAVADQFGVDMGAARLGVVVGFKHHAARAFAHDEAVAVAVVGPRSRFGPIVETGRKRAAGGEARDANAIDRRFGAARDHHLGLAERDKPRGVANRVRAGGAGRHDGVIRALEAMHDGYIARGEIDDPAGNEEGRDAARPLLLQRDRRLVDSAKAPDARADQHAGRLLLLGGVGLPAGVGQRLGRRASGVDDKVVDLALFLGVEPLVGIESAVGAGAARHNRRDLARKIIDLERVDALESAFARDQATPIYVNTTA